MSFPHSYVLIHDVRPFLLERWDDDGFVIYPRCQDQAPLGIKKPNLMRLGSGVYTGAPSLERLFQSNLAPNYLVGMKQTELVFQ